MEKGSQVLICPLPFGHQLEILEACQKSKGDINGHV